MEHEYPLKLALLRIENREARLVGVLTAGRPSSGRTALAASTPATDTPMGLSGHETLDKGQAHAKENGHRALRLTWALAGLTDFTA